MTHGATRERARRGAVDVACSERRGADHGRNRQDEAVGQSLNYVFATDLGSGVYDLDGRTLQIYRFTYEKELREVDEITLGVRFVLPLTFGFFDFHPLDVLSEGIPTRVDSFSLVPGLELDYLLHNDWHLIPYVRGGASVASSSVDGWLYGLGVRMERERDGAAGTASCAASSTSPGVGYRQDLRDDQFVRFRQGFNLARGIGWKIRGREVEFGMYGIFDIILDPPTAPVADAHQAAAAGGVRHHLQHAAAVQALALGRAAPRLRLPVRGRAVGVALPHRRAVLNGLRPPSAGSSRSAQAVPPARAGTRAALRNVPGKRRAPACPCTSDVWRRLRSTVTMSRSAAVNLSFQIVAARE